MRRRVGRGVPLLLCALILAGCDDGGGGMEPGAGPGSITGTVARQKTAEGVPGAVVALLGDDGGVLETAITDGNGRFSFQGLAQGEYQVRLVAPELAGLDPLFDALEPPSWEVELTADPVDLVFAVVGLVPARITGTIVCGGAAAAGGEVRVVGGETDATAASDAAGIFTVLDLLPGTYAVIPLSPPCVVDPPFVAATVRPGQFVDLSFGG